MRRKIKQKIGFLHPERGVNEPVRRTRQATSAEHPGAEDDVQGALTDAEGPGIVRFRVPRRPEEAGNTRQRGQIIPDGPGYGISDANRYYETPERAFPTPKYFERLRICRIQS